MLKWYPISFNFQSWNTRNYS